MKIIILEGIATSGKTTIKNILTKKLSSKKLSFEIVDEEQTLMPILNNTEKEISIKFLSNILENNLILEKEIIIFDRLFFTHIFKTNSKLKDFKNIENILLKHNILLVLLTIRKNKIAERIFGAMKHRGKKWEEFVRKKGTEKEIIEYYKNQQQFLLKLTKQSSIPHIIKDTTDMDFEIIKKTILKKIIKNE